MAAVTAASAAAWAKAEKLYADPEVKYAEIAEVVGLAPIQFSLAAKKRGWPPRIASQSKGKSKNKTKPGRAKKTKQQTGASDDAPALLVHSVYKTITSELKKLKLQQGDTSQDRERASRALSQMVNSLGKAIDMHREMTKTPANGSGPEQKDQIAHAEDLRREIAERLERLQRERTCRERSDEAE